MNTPQLPLPFEPAEAFEAADFIEAPSNAAALAWLARPAEWPAARLAVWGEAGCGKSHLLDVWAARHGTTRIKGGALDPDAVPNLPNAPVVIDDADRAPELALLRRLNTAAEAGQPVLLAARAAPGRWEVKLPDLASRLRAITAVEIGAPEDELLRLLLQRLLAARQLAVAESFQEHMLRRLPRTPGTLRLAAARLDAAALAAGGKVTRRVVEAAIGPLADHGADVDLGLVHSGPDRVG